MPVAAIEVGPLCECGCGERLPIGSTRKYKRGHKAEANRQLADQMEANGVFDGYNFRQELPYNAEPINPYEFAGNSDMVGWETIQDAAENVPNDPEGANFWESNDVFERGQRAAEFEFKIPRGVAKDVQGKVAFMLSTTAMAVGLVDDYCGNSILENTPQISKALTPILCQSPGVVAWFTRTSNVMLYVNLAMAMAPVAMAIMNHHLGPKPETIPVPANGQMNINPNMYGVQ
jgi:hypothetical protein